MASAFVFRLYLFTSGLEMKGLSVMELVFADAEDAFTWYNKQIEGLGNRFYHQFLNTLENIQAKPLTFSYLKELIRRCRM